MSIKRMFSLFVGLTFVAVVVLTVRAGSATSEVVSSSAVVLDQHERHAGLINLGVARAEPARMEYRRGEWYASASASALALDQHERHPGFIGLGMAAEQARLEYRRGEWYAANSSSSAFDVEQGRIGWRPSALRTSAQDDAGRRVSSNKDQNATGNARDQQRRDAIQARWLAQDGGTNRTCVLMCGGQ